MTADELRSVWTKFFTDRQHHDVPSSSLIPTHPSAPMFTNSGMMQFVPYFLGEEPVPFSPPRAVSVQKCVRAGGKHNDLDAIGRSARHLSFFEMLGNFSFGDYFKAEAIPWAWEFVTEALGIDAERIWVTCHVDDDEAEAIWVDSVGFPRERIQRLDKDNFWEMGETGPCGPSSEIFFDFGADAGPVGGPANPASENRYVEIWNLVFTQYFRGSDGSLSDLPNRNVDTGAGMERILAVLAGSPSLYSADVLSRLVESAQKVTGHRIGQSDLGDIALRLLADHTRTSVFLVSDGVIPSNEDRGYVLRRIIRRAVRFAYMLDVSTLVLPPLAEACVEIMGNAYPELDKQSDFIIDMITREEEKFRTTLARGSNLLDENLEGLPVGQKLDGKVAFELHDTFGFPLEVTEEMADLRGVKVDTVVFEEEMAAQRERSRAAAKKTGVAADDDAAAERALLNDHGPTEFIGREHSTSQAKVIGIIGNSVFLDRTPFYAESGGQVGDTGTITGPVGTLTVIDTTYAIPGLLARHVIDVSDTDGAVALQVGDSVVGSIDTDRRNSIRRNHTATHILHWALREVLGDHVKQQGSLVAPDRLRFDFSHFAGVTDDEIRRIEDLANTEVLDNAVVDHFETTMDEARELGAIAFFGEKYGERVRVLRAGAHSTELCGGTHVSALGDIGLIKIVSEGSIGSNIRRIEAVTGLGVLSRIRGEEEVAGRAAELLGVNPDGIVDGVERRLAEIKALRGELKELRAGMVGSLAKDLAAAAVDGVIVARVEVDSRDALRDMAVSIRDQPGVQVVVLAGSPGGKGVGIVAAVEAQSGVNAGELIADAVGILGGGGGKGAELAVAGGRYVEMIDEALENVREKLG
ncbi:MAG: alanine--tRNA ligase [Microthrixaceae bacterium]